MNLFQHTQGDPFEEDYIQVRPGIVFLLEGKYYEMLGHYKVPKIKAAREKVEMTQKNLDSWQRLYALSDAPTETLLRVPGHPDARDLTPHGLIICRSPRPFVKKGERVSKWKPYQGIPNDMKIGQGGQLLLDF